MGGRGGLLIITSARKKARRARAQISYGRSDCIDGHVLYDKDTVAMDEGQRSIVTCWRALGFLSSSGDEEGKESD